MHLLIVLTVLAVWPAHALPALSETIGCEEKPVDIYFLLDCSSSVWIVDFEKQLDFVVSLINRMHIAPNATRVGLGVFSNNFEPVVDLGGYPDKNTLIRAVKKAPYRSGDTYTGRGINGMRTQGFRSDAASRNVTRVGVVVTDGKSRYPSNTEAEAIAARDAGIWLFAIGVGREVDVDELKAIASQPPEEFVLQVATFDILTTLVSRLAVSICSAEQPQADDATCGRDRKADVMFVYNAAAMSTPNVTTVRQFIKETVHEFSIGTGNVRVGVVSEGCQTGDIELGKHLRRDSFMAELLAQPAPSLGSLLKRLRVGGFEPARGGRPDAAKLAVIFVDHVLTSFSDVTYEALMLKYKASIYVIAIGSSYDESQVKVLTSPSQVTRVPEYGALLDPKYRTEFLKTFCQGL